MFLVNDMDIKNFKGAIFDLDGTLLDSMGLWHKVDIAFFENENHRIVHVGILLSRNMIIHASGEVRIDAIDETGIFNNELNKYTHYLNKVKRLK